MENSINFFFFLETFPKEIFSKTCLKYEEETIVQSQCGDKMLMVQ